MTSFSIVRNIGIKIIFFICIILQVILWPSVFTVTFASALALEGIITYLTTDRKELYDLVVGNGVLLFHGSGEHGRSIRRYVITALVGIYTCFYFLRFTNLEIERQPRMTNWIHPHRIMNYTYGDGFNNPLPNVEVTDDISKEMRKNPFVWPKVHESPAIILNGTLSEGKPQSNGNLHDLNCHNDDIDSNYSCYAANIVSYEVPEEGFYGKKHMMVPMSSQFYVVDVQVTPRRNIIQCENLEVYRIVVNGEKQVVFPLDYPASALPPATSSVSSSMTHKHCGLFGDSSWCLRYEHSFSDQEYRKRIKQKCEDGKGSFIFRLPIRTIDVNPENGRVDLDALIVSKFADVKLKFIWHYESSNVPPPVMTLEQWVGVPNDEANNWRESSQFVDVFFKFAIAVTPLFIVWYILAKDFFSIISDTNQVLFLCVFVLLPSSLVFLSVGAWLPMAGCIVCAIAINHAPVMPSLSTSKLSWYKRYWRPILFFFAAVCNSVQFAWVITLVVQAGWPAFYYDYSIKQLAALSSQFIISNTMSPTWIALILPTSLSINLSFLIGSAICIVLESMPHWHSSSLK